MSELKLVIGNKNYSSWSLRLWLARKVAGIAFTEERIPLYGPGSKEKILAGHFSIADAMYAPVVLRFRTYEVELPPGCRGYADTILALPALQDWMAAAVTETESLPQFEMYG